MSDKPSGLKHIVRKGKNFTKMILEVPDAIVVYRDTKQLNKIKINEDTNNQDLMDICHDADKKNFYVTKIPSYRGRKITYRILSTAYRSSRDGAKKVYRAVKKGSTK